MTPLPSTSTQSGLVMQSCRRSFQETLELLMSRVPEKGMTLFAHIDHTAAAEAVGLHLRPTSVVIFGSPKAGTPLMDAFPALAIDLPLKMLVWQDDAGQTWLAYTDPGWLAERHGLGTDLRPTILAMTAALSAIAHDVC